MTAPHSWTIGTCDPRTHIESVGPRTREVALAGMFRPRSPGIETAASRGARGRPRGDAPHAVAPRGSSASACSARRQGERYHPMHPVDAPLERLAHPLPTVSIHPCSLLPAPCFPLCAVAFTFVF